MAGLSMFNFTPWAIFVSLWEKEAFKISKEKIPDCFIEADLNKVAVTVLSCCLDYCVSQYV